MELKQDKEWYITLFYPIFIARRFIFVVWLVLLVAYTETQLNLFIFSTSLVSLYYLWVNLDADVHDKCLPIQK